MSAEGKPLAAAQSGDQAAPSRAARWWAAVERWLEWSGDRLNPILVKETRQALKSRQFVVTFGLLLLCGWGWSIIGMAVAYAAFNASVVFGVMNCWLAVWHPLMAMVAGFAMVTAYRQLTEERAKRRIRALFAHAMSPALVDRLLEDPSVARLGGERRVVTCFFSDMAGFTSLSERLGEQGTVSLLNRYFDRMTDVIQNRNGGYLNKFLGDGLFVFFGAPVFQDDHPARAIRAAID